MIPMAEPLLDGNELNYVTDCIKTNWISSIGHYVTDFETAFSQFCGSRFGVATTNGTTALHLALAALDIGPGDEVIVPSLTFVATANVVAYTGAKAVFVDSEMATWNIDVRQIESKVNARTKAIIPVHLLGHPCDMDAIHEIANRRNLHVIEDAAEAHGSEYKGKRVGGLSRLACFSFYGNKVITTGEGGLVVTDDKELADKCRVLRDHGMSKEKPYWHTHLGFNYRMTNIQAAIGVAQMERIEEFISRKREIAHKYRSILASLTKVTLPPEQPWAKNIYWMYGILLDDGIDRDGLRDGLRARGVDSRPFFYPIHTLPHYNTGEHLEAAERISKRGLLLPSFVKLADEQIEYICVALKEELETSRE